jgi:hypothetical protein
MGSVPSGALSVLGMDTSLAGISMLGIERGSERKTTVSADIVSLLRSFMLSHTGLLNGESAMRRSSLIVVSDNVIIVLNFYTLLFFTSIFILRFPYRGQCHIIRNKNTSFLFNFQFFSSPAAAWGGLLFPTPMPHTQPLKKVLLVVIYY